MRLVFDCNVLISAFLNDISVPGQALLKAKSTSSTLLISDHVLAELIEVLMRPKFDKYSSVDLRQFFFEELESLSTRVKIARRLKICRDPKDDKYLELAIAGEADCIITGDPDLLVLHLFENIPIITPKEFLDRF